MTRHRVAITGIGVKTPAGVTVEDAFQTVLNGKSTARFIDELGEHDITVPIGCAVPDFELGEYFTLREVRQLDRVARLGVAAAADAVRDAGIDFGPDTHRIGVAVGTGGAGSIATTEAVATAQAIGSARVTAHTVPMIMPSATAARISLRFGLRGPSLTYVTACAAGANALGEAMRMIRDGYLDAVVAGGADAPLSPVVMDSFGRMGALSRRIDDPAAASRPFDQDRDGFVMGEGAAFLVLERWDHAVSRGARIYAELAGYGSNSEAHHIVAPLDTGASVAACMRIALADAGIDAGDIGHVNAHGTSTVANDRAEARGMLRCFGDAAPAVTATKGVVGHMIGAAGAFEAAITALSIDCGVVAPVANFERSDFESLDLVSEAPRQLPAAPALSNSFGFGGHSASLVLAPA
jgi:3-oxoacyl-[acyl-carrier-protein] synthase II